MSTSSQFPTRERLVTASCSSCSAATFITFWTRSERAYSYRTSHHDEAPCLSPDSRLAGAIATVAFKLGRRASAITIDGDKFQFSVGTLLLSLVDGAIILVPHVVRVGIVSVLSTTVLMLAGYIMTTGRPNVSTPFSGPAPGLAP
jgi:hypothetical protein